ncbi:MAG: fimbrial protein [Candidatus Cryptobacteroides sp.]
MRKQIHITAAAMMAAIGFISCSTENATDIRLPEYAELTVHLSGGENLAAAQSGNTRAALDIDKEFAVNNVQIFVFRKDGSLDAYSNGAKKDGIKLTCTTGEKTVIAVVNAPDMSSVISKDELLGTKSLLTHNTLSNFVMTGETGEDIKGNKSITVNVKRIAARISIESIEVDYESDAYKSAEVKLTGIYVLNAAGESDYALTAKPGIWYNKGSYLQSGVDALIYKNIGGTTLSEGSPYSIAEYFYVYPNRETWAVDSEWPVTKLVVETTINGKAYYYPVRFPDIVRNTKYRIPKLTITRPGSDDPDVEVVSNDCTFSIIVDDWDKGSEDNVVI